MLTIKDENQHLAPQFYCKLKNLSASSLELPILYRHLLFNSCWTVRFPKMTDRASLLPTNGTHVGLEEVTQKDLHDWGVTYHVYRAEPGDPFEEVNISENEASPLYRSGEQTIM